MLYRHELKVFLLSKGKPAGPPQPGPVLVVEAPTLDGLLPTAKRVLPRSWLGWHTGPFG